MPAEWQLARIESSAARLRQLLAMPNVPVQIMLNEHQIITKYAALLERAIRARPNQGEQP